MVLNKSLSKLNDFNARLMRHISLKDILPYALAFSLGLGMFKLTFLLALFSAIVFRSQYKHIFGAIKIGGWILIALLVAFLFFYLVDYIPYQLKYPIIEAHYFKMLWILTVLAAVLPFLMKNKIDALSLIWYFGVGAFVWAVSTVIATVLLSAPPYYGKIVDLRSLARGSLHFGNTPGIASLLVFYPVIFLAIFGILKQKKSPWFWCISFIGLFATLICAILLQQRSFFVIALVVQPIIMTACAFFLGRYKIGFVILCTLIVYPLLFFIDSFIEIGLLTRKLDQGLFTDARVQMFEFWLNQISANPLARPLVGPVPWDQLHQFHNFFADVHRTSGLWALSFAVLLVAYIFLRLIILIFRDKQSGFYLIAIAIPVFLVMMTSVVPEGEKQPLLALLLVGGLAERLLSNGKMKPL